MTCALVIAGSIRQVMLTPETEEERLVLNTITAKDDISVVEEADFYDVHTLGYNVDMCRGGYLRAFKDSKSLMLVVRPKEVK